MRGLSDPGRIGGGLRDLRQRLAINVCRNLPLDSLVGEMFETGRQLGHQMRDEVGAIAHAALSSSQSTSPASAMRSASFGPVHSAIRPKLDITHLAWRDLACRLQSIGLGHGCVYSHRFAHPSTR